MTTTKTKHTQGPWKIDKRGMISGEQIDICKMQYNGAVFGSTCEEDVANARIIASAPELLEACNKAIKLLNKAPMLSVTDKSISETIIILNNAISKAEGTL